MIARRSVHLRWELHPYRDSRSKPIYSAENLPNLNHLSESSDCATMGLRRPCTQHMYGRRLAVKIFSSTDISSLHTFTRILIATQLSLFVTPSITKFCLRTIDFEFRRWPKRSKDNTSRPARPRFDTEFYFGVKN